MTTVRRADSSAIQNFQVTPQGFLKIPANLTRVGVLVYRRADGSEFRELRHPDEVFKADSLASLAGAPLTDLHPSEFVGPENVRNLQRGFVGSDVRQDGNHVAAHVIVQDAETIKAIKEGRRKELSPGYTCKIDATPGEWNGERYDGRQIDIQYNHLAVGPQGWGRSGSSVALRLDDSGKELTPAEGSVIHFDGWPTGPEDQTNMKTIRIDGKDHQVDEASAGAIETLIAQRDSAKAEADKATARLDSMIAEEPKRIAAAVQARVAVLKAAEKILGSEVKLDGKTDREIMIDVATKVHGAFEHKDRSDDYVQARFDAAVNAFAKTPQTSELDAFKGKDGTTETQHTDASDKDEVEEARKRHREFSANAWKQNLKTK